MHEIFLMQQQNIWLELEMNRFMMLARLVRFNRDLVSGWWLLLKKASREKWIWALAGSGRRGLLAAGARACDSRANQSAAES